MARDKYGILPPPRVGCGVVVQVRDNQGRLTQSRAIVMGRAKGDAHHRNFERAYGPEYVICEVHADAKKATMVASDAIKEGRIADAKRIIDQVTSVDERNISLLVPRGKVKKIPKICLLAVKAEKGKL